MPAIVCDGFVVGRAFQMHASLEAFGAEPTLRLFKNDVVPTVHSVFVDFAEADFSGYTHSVPNLNDPAQEEPGRWRIWNETPTTWTHNGGGTANTVYGWYLTWGSSFLIMAERFETPLVFDTLDQSVQVDMFLDVLSEVLCSG